MKKGWDFEADLVTIKDRLENTEFALKVYAALCNVSWRPVYQQHEAGCMKITKEIPAHLRNNTGRLVDGRIVWGPPNPWCTCGLAYSASWRAAAGLIADIRNRGEDYMDFYCSGNEGIVHETVALAFEALGWVPDGTDYETVSDVNLVIKPTPWKHRLIVWPGMSFQTLPFPYLFHRWDVRHTEMGWIGSTFRYSSAEKLLAETKKALLT